MGGDRFLDLAQQGRNGLQSYLVSLFLLWLLLLPFHIFQLQASGSTTGFQTTLYLYLIQTVPFTVLLIGLVIALRRIHQRPFLTLITSHKQVRYGRVAQGFSFWLLLLGLTTLLQFLENSFTFRLNFPSLQWVFFLPIVLMATPLQAATEELLFRGYGLQGIGQLTRKRPLLISLSGLIFAIAHASSSGISTGSHPVWAFCYYFTCGSFPALITLWDDSLELAIGWHIAHNLFGSLVLQTASSPLQTPAVLTSPLPFNFQTGLVIFLIQAAIFCVILLGQHHIFIRRSQTKQHL